ncbi:hypothetical protein B9Z55_027972 [Caenorhabditis nigoni]|nr:hypothetical protein B9Z55_027972 [Caenorhabditis nigoni]
MNSRARRVPSVEFVKLSRIHIKDIVEHHTTLAPTMSLKRIRTTKGSRNLLFPPHLKQQLSLESTTTTKRRMERTRRLSRPALPKFQIARIYCTTRRLRLEAFGLSSGSAFAECRRCNGTEKEIMVASRYNKLPSGFPTLMQGLCGANT